MTKINLQGPGVALGNLKVDNPLDNTLQVVKDTAGNGSPLELSTDLVSVSSTLQIATDDTTYIDAEDSLGNNRFTVSRVVGQQVVNIDFASNPTLSETVGAIRTYKDGVNLTVIVGFEKNGTINIKGNNLTNFIPIINSDAVGVTIDSTNQDSYCAGVLEVTGAITITIDDSVRDGFSISVIQMDANQCTFAASGGSLTLQNRQGHTQTAGQWATVTLFKNGNNLILAGDTA